MDFGHLLAFRNEPSVSSASASCDQLLHWSGGSAVDLRLVRGSDCLAISADQLAPLGICVCNGTYPQITFDRINALLLSKSLGTHRADGLLPIVPRSTAGHQNSFHHEDAFSTVQARPNCIRRPLFCIIILIRSADRLEPIDRIVDHVAANETFHQDKIIASSGRPEPELCSPYFLPRGSQGVRGLC